MPEVYKAKEVDVLEKLSEISKSLDSKLFSDDEGERASARVEVSNLIYFEEYYLTRELKLD